LKQYAAEQSSLFRQTGGTMAISLKTAFWLLREGEGTEYERCTWKAKYPSQAAIDQKRNELGDIGFRREMLLQVVPEEGHDVHPERHHLLRRPAVRRRQSPCARRRPRDQH
jgi:hypothetical protein